MTEISADGLRFMARRIIEIKASGIGRAEATKWCARRAGMNVRSLQRLINGEMKDPGIRLFEPLRLAYVETLSRRIAELQMEASIASAVSDHAPISELDREISAICRKFEDIKGSKA
ncbi:hypothetical protein JET14_13405 [Martelella lutilitoris]|uniref:Uncharacterized protein n=1 Tax=Martelella lutilitoris TaxID=2583532 RepID=A0A7T7HHK1_9HYPH|nr:hypothetical protein [Martelella lutilitoris]QQM29321.1 hypothetical protein JET14_13405 [Martelella lutilitoris]